MKKEELKRRKQKAPTAPATICKTSVREKIVARGAPRAIPERIVPEKLGDYLEIMTMASFQAGVSWALIQSKWDNFIHAFDNFEPSVVSKYEKNKIDKLLLDPGIIRSEKKIVGTIENARTMLMLESEFGSFQKYLRSFISYQNLSADIRQRFQFVGEVSVYYLLFRAGEPVPDFDSWLQTIKGEHPRMREMVDKYPDYEKCSLLGDDLTNV